MSNTSCKDATLAIPTNDIPFEGQPRQTFSGFGTPAATTNVRFEARATNATFEVQPAPSTVQTLPTRSKAWTQTIKKLDLKKSANAETMFNTSKIKIAIDSAIADAGATGHFVLPGAPVIDIKPAAVPLIINLPDGEVIKSTHTCKLNLPFLPEAATRAHIVPGLAHTSLVSIKILCDAGCEVNYNGKECLVYYKNKLVWTGRREESTKLWVLPLSPTTKP